MSVDTPTASRPLSLTVTQTQTHHSQTARAHSSSLSERVSDALTNFNARPAPRHGAMARSPHSAPPMRGKIPLPTFSAADAAAALRSPPCHRAPCSHRRPSPGPHRRPTAAHAVSTRAVAAAADLGGLEGPYPKTISVPDASRPAMTATRRTRTFIGDTP